MELQIQYPSISIENDLGRFFLNLQDASISRQLIEDPCPVGNEIIRKSFEEAFVETHAMFSFDQEPATIRIEIEDDLGRIRPDNLAAFDLYKTELNNIFTFSLSGHIILESICREYEIPYGDKFMTLKALWYHELVHLADYERLKQYRQIQERDGESWLKQREVMVRFPYEDLDSQLPREWQFLNALSQVRNEGLAELFQILTGYGECRIKSGEKARHIFRQEFKRLTTILSRNKQALLSDQDLRIYSDFLEGFQRLAYVFGPWFVLDILTNVMPESPLPQLAASILSGENQPLPVEECCRLVKRGLALDCGSCLRLISEPGAKHPWGTFVEHEELISLFHYLSLDDAYLGEYPNFITSIIESASSRNLEGFLSTLRIVLGTPMRKYEIEVAFDLFLRKRPDEQTQSAVRQLAIRIMEMWKESHDNLLTWMLTYILDPEDLIHDKVPYLGYLDDQYVLQAGLHLYQRNNA